MKKNIKIILITLIVVISLNSIACRKGEFADEYTNVKWYSYDPVLEFSYGEDDHTRGVGYIIVDNIKIDIYCKWGFNRTLLVYKLDDVDFENHVINGETYLLCCYTINKKVVTYTIEEDRFFNGLYENQELKMYCEDL